MNRVSGEGKVLSFYEIWMAVEIDNDSNVEVELRQKNQP